MATDGEIKDAILVLQNRQCPACHKPIKLYTLATYVIPTEHRGEESAKFAKAVNSEITFYFFGQNSYSFLERICLTADCDCGNISWWTFNDAIFEALVSKELYDQGYGIKFIYDKDGLQEMYDKAPEGYSKKSLNDLLKLFQPRDSNGNK